MSLRRSVSSTPAPEGARRRLDASFPRLVGAAGLAAVVALGISHSSLAQAAPEEQPGSSEHEAPPASEPGRALIRGDEGPSEPEPEVEEWPDEVEAFADEVWIEEPEPSSREFIGFGPGSFAAQLSLGPSLTVGLGEEGYFARVGAEVGTVLWIDWDQEWQTSTGVSGYVVPSDGGGGNLEQEFLWKIGYVRAGPGWSRGMIYGADPNEVETALGGTVGAGLALWRLRAGVAYEGRSSFGADPRRTDTLQVTLAVATLHDVQDLGGGGIGGDFDVGCIILMMQCN